MRFGSGSFDVRFGSDSGAEADIAGCPSCATTGPEHSQQTTAIRSPRRRRRAEVFDTRTYQIADLDQLRESACSFFSSGGFFATYSLVSFASFGRLQGCSTAGPFIGGYGPLSIVVMEGAAEQVVGSTFS